MATFDSSRSAPFGAITSFRIISVLDDMRVALVAWNNTRSTQNTLAKLSDHELNDIGLSRGDIGSISATRRR